MKECSKTLYNFEEKCTLDKLVNCTCGSSSLVCCIRCFSADLKTRTKVMHRNVSQGCN